MSAFLYVLGSTSKTTPKTYVGWTTDLDQRLAAHNAGRGAKSTRGYQWQLLYAEKLETPSAAMSREVYLKKDRNFRRDLRRGLQG